MNRLLLLLILMGIGHVSLAQYVYTIKADSVKITNTCDTAELIIENHTQMVPGFLFNKGRGRTEFRRVMHGINDTLVMIGPDTLRLPNAWVQGGNKFNSTGIFGTLDNNHIDFFTNGQKRGRWTNTGNLLIGNGNDLGYKLQIQDRGSIVFFPYLSRPTDRIVFGGGLSSDDGQNMIISTFDGTTSHPVLLERNGNIGMGSGSPAGFDVGSPTFRINVNGKVSIASTEFYFGTTGGPFNSSALMTSVSNGNEWLTGDGYPNGQNHYYLGTTLQNPTSGNSRAPLKMGAKYLSFNTGAADIEAVRITADQKVMIGPGNPSAYPEMLQLYGSFLQGYENTCQFGNGLLFNRYNSMSRIISGSGIQYQSNSVGDQHLFRNEIGSQFTGTLVTIDPGGEPNLPDNQLSLKVLGKNGAPLALAINMAGQVGIGNLAPTAKLHVAGTVRLEGLTNNNNLTRVVVTDANGNLYCRDFPLATNGVMNSDLAVNGTVSAQKMLLSQTGRWPDYVFSKQYQLPSLTEVENFINQNNHLPGIPSAAEVAKKGIDVADNQAALLKKIEELTLYVIELEKRSQKQNEEISELKKQNNELKDNKDLNLLKKQVAELMTIIKNK
ncbi:MULTISPECIES: hypothetical protein [Niastella]|uniref:Peptidase S74 domain-containing protein n=1 Tax=Niastella soli TaxID=2821487 RepID=A0ABS3Z2W9_9BACT|nr:hypothetical protein [Niastella soli]MBO9204517.1 hypothetical protein [Niastella soli]